MIRVFIKNADNPTPVAKLLHFQQFCDREVQNADKKYQIKFLAKIIHRKHQKSEKMGIRKKPDGKIEYFQF